MAQWKCRLTENCFRLMDLRTRCSNLTVDCSSLLGSQGFYTTQLWWLALSSIVTFGSEVWVDVAAVGWSWSFARRCSLAGRWRMFDCYRQSLEVIRLRRLWQYSHSLVCLAAWLCRGATRIKCRSRITRVGLTEAGFVRILSSQRNTFSPSSGMGAMMGLVGTVWQGVVPSRCSFCTRTHTSEGRTYRQRYGGLEWSWCWTYSGLIYPCHSCGRSNLRHRSLCKMKL